MATALTIRRSIGTQLVPAQPLPWFVGAAVLGYYLRQFAFRLGDPDLWGRLAVGQLVLEGPGLPRTDPFAYTPTLPLWVDHEWLTGVVFFALHRLGGEPALLVAKTVLGLVMLGLVWATARRAGAEAVPTWIFLALVLPVFGYGLMPRAQLFTYVGFAGWLYVLEGYRRGGRALPMVVLPLSMIPWANLHGGFLAGLGLVGLYAASLWREPRRAATVSGVMLASAAASLVNPYGLDYWRYLLMAVPMERPGIREWDPVPFTWDYAQFWLLAAVAAGSLVYEVVGRRRANVPALVLAVPLVLALQHARHMPLLAIVASGLLPPLWFAGRRRFRDWQRDSLGAAGWGTLALLASVTLFQVFGLVVLDGPARFELPETPPTVGNMIMFPVGGIEAAVGERLEGNLAVPFNWGEYAIWHLWPQCRVSMDGRYETAYPQATTEMVEQFFDGTGDWRALIDRQPTDHVLAPAEARVNALLEQDGGWRLRYRDGVSVLWSRRAG